MLTCQCNPQRFCAVARSTVLDTKMKIVADRKWKTLTTTLFMEHII